MSRTRLLRGCPSSVRLGIGLAVAALAIAAALIDVSIVGPRVYVRWQENLGAAERAERERRYDLRNGEPDRQSPDTWQYEIGTRSRENLLALVNDSAAVDTHGIDRAAFTTEAPRIAWTMRELPGPFRLLNVSALPRPAQWFVGLLGLAASFLAYACWRQWPRIGPGITGAVLVTMSLVFAAAFCWPLVERAMDFGVRRDWDYYLLAHWIPYETVRHYGQIPLWDPYRCGGLPMLGNPASSWLSPFFLLHVWLGPEPGLRIEIVMHVALAWLGAFVLGRTAGLSRIAAFAPAVVFAGCSTFYLRLGEGHTMWLPYVYLPWILAAAVARRPLVAGALLALTIGEGGDYAGPHAALVLVLLAAYRGLTEKNLRPFRELSLSAAMAFCLAAPKLLVVHELMTRYPRLIESTESMDFALLLQALFSRVQDLAYQPPGQLYGFHEYGAYLGPVPVVLAAVGVWKYRRAAAPWLLLAALGLTLSLGYTIGADYSPWALLHRLPIFASQHVPSRFILLAVLAVGMLAGLGLEAFGPHAGRRRAAALALLAVASLDAAMVGPHNLTYAFERERETLPSAQTFVQLRDASDARMYSIALANMGALNCYEPLLPAAAPLGMNDPGYRGEQYLLSGGDVRLVEWSPHRLVFDVVSNGPDLLVVNQNHDASWRVADGRGKVVAHAGLLAVHVPPGTQRLSLGYSSRRFGAGVALAGIALVVAAAASILRRRDRRSLRPPACHPARGKAWDD